MIYPFSPSPHSKFYWGTQAPFTPEETVTKHPNVINFASSQSVYSSTTECLTYPQLKAFALIAEVSQKGDKSDGMSNELSNILSLFTGTYQSIAIGGDRYPGSTFVDHSPAL
ncbi:hypothetical protein M378DRAFT_181279 [Amanita muscaria Koide BX008]|uniref:Uncharacterized protein n=1 Tax=Amanita muscaria (strain Koide BX008) TaxID=946122 RepID=A0A0C2WP16_AMAMK|nr:hypothetical protein M378DRAFT_181279 [Amanita muscaria Koide BX008]